MSNIQYNYEYVFFDNFDITVFSNGPVLDIEMLNLVQDCVNRINNILLNNKGLKNLSTFVKYKGITYKVTVQIPSRYKTTG
jgi:hypothetical protein